MVASVARYEDWVVYGLRLAGATEYRYVGQTQFGATYRLGRHRNTASYRKLPLYSWMNKHPGEIEIDVLESTDSRDLEVLDNLEQFWIAQLTEKGCRLLNVDKGGRSAQNQTEQSRLARTRSGPDHYNYGKKHSPETREKLSIARRARVTQDSTRAKYSKFSIKNNPNSKLTK